MRESFKKLYALLGSEEKSSFAILVAVMVLEALLEMIGIGLIPIFITIVAYPENLVNYEYYHLLRGMVGEYWLHGERIIYLSGVIVLVFFIFKNIYTALSTYTKTRYAQNRSLQLSKRLFRAYMEAPFEYHLVNGSTELIRNISAECTLLSNKVLMPIVDFMSQLIIVLGVTSILVLSVPANVLLWLLLFIGMGAGTAVLLNKRLKALGKEAQAKRAEVLKIVREGLEGVKEIKLLQKTSYFIDAMGSVFTWLLSIERFMKVLQKALPDFIELMAIVGLIGVTVMLFATGRSPNEVVPILSVFAVSLVRMKGSLRAVILDYTEIKHSEVSLDVVYAGLNELEKPSPEIVAPQCDRKLKFSTVVELNDVGYRYPGADHDALSCVNLEIRKGESIGVVGTTGAGKSTLIDIILGILKPQRGRVAVDGFDMFQYVGDWQKRVGYIPQMIFLVDGTITQNIALGVNPGEIDLEKVREAARAANVSGLIEKLPNKLDTVIGERGVRLSGGERQRIVIARALYHGPDVLIMDEATSALDNVTERAIINEVGSLKGGRTVIMIAHRLSTVRNCDRILFLKDGLIDAIGSYDELANSHADFIRMTEAV